MTGSDRARMIGRGLVVAAGVAAPGRSARGSHDLAPASARGTRPAGRLRRREHGRGGGALGSVRPGRGHSGGFGAARSSSNPARVRRSCRRREARRSSDGDCARRWGRIARRLALYAVEYRAGLATWWTVMAVATSAALTVPIALAATRAGRAAGIRSAVEGAAGDVFDDLPVRVPRRPWALCAAVALLAALAAGVVTRATGRTPALRRSSTSSAASGRRRSPMTIAPASAPSQERGRAPRGEPGPCFPTSCSRRGGPLVPLR